MKIQKKCSLMVILSLLAIFTLSCTFCGGGRRGERIDSWETVNGNLKIRVTEYEESDPVPVPHLTNFFYVFESAGAASGDWQEIMSVKNDDDIPLPRDQIRILNDQIAYVFMNEKYAVTTNGGRSWDVWEATPKNLPKLQFPANIRDVQIAIDGSGVMQLGSLLNGQITTLTVSTNDHGRHWNLE